MFNRIAELEKKQDDQTITMNEESILCNLIEAAETAMYA
jgi:hypothetical protein